MPRYYFHIRSPSGLEKDPQGVEFDTLDAAIADARQAGAEILLDEAVEEARGQERASFEIVDDTGRVVATVPISA